MVAVQPGHQPATAPDPYPFRGLTDEQVLHRATGALRRVHETPLGSVARAIQWAAYEQAKAELDMRLYARTLRKLDRPAGVVAPASPEQARPLTADGCSGI